MPPLTTRKPHRTGLVMVLHVVDRLLCNSTQYRQGAQCARWAVRSAQWVGGWAAGGRVGRWRAGGRAVGVVGARCRGAWCGCAPNGLSGEGGC